MSRPRSIPVSYDVVPPGATQMQACVQKLDITNKGYFVVYQANGVGAPYIVYGHYRSQRAAVRKGVNVLGSLPIPQDGKIVFYSGTPAIAPWRWINYGGGSIN